MALITHRPQMVDKLHPPAVLDCASRGRSLSRIAQPSLRPEEL